jgi:trans-2,3-dihydro-3-hydroxyanthranilate isomerase
MASPTRRALPYVIMDVFTPTPLEGNALAVFTDARGLSGPELQAVARETHLSETTFVFPDPSAAPDSPVRVRIFTVDEELPFAGHPTLGTAAALRSASRAHLVTLALDVGPIPVAFEDRPAGSFGEMRHLDPVFGQRHSMAEVAQAVGLSQSELDDRFPIETVSTGLPFAIVAIRSLATLQNLRCDWRRLSEYLAFTDAHFFYFVSRETVAAEARLHARMLFYGGEDPATGSAAGCAAAWMRRHEIARDDERVIIEQGLEAKRPSTIYVRARGGPAEVTDVHVGGYVTEVARGEFRI